MGRLSLKDSADILSSVTSRMILPEVKRAQIGRLGVCDLWSDSRAKTLSYTIRLVGSASVDGIRWKNRLLKSRPFWFSLFGSGIDFVCSRNGARHLFGKLAKPLFKDRCNLLSPV